MTLRNMYHPEYPEDPEPNVNYPMPEVKPRWFF